MSDGYNSQGYYQSDPNYQAMPEQQYYYQEAPSQYPVVYEEFVMPACNFQQDYTYPGYYVEPAYSGTDYVDQTGYAPQQNYYMNQQPRGQGSYRGKKPRGSWNKPGARSDNSPDQSLRQGVESEDMVGPEMASPRASGARPKQSYQGQRADRARRERSERGQRGHMPQQSQRNRGGRWADQNISEPYPLHEQQQNQYYETGFQGDQYSQGKGYQGNRGYGMRGRSGRGRGGYQYEQRPRRDQDRYGPPASYIKGDVSQGSLGQENGSMSESSRSNKPGMSGGKRQGQYQGKNFSLRNSGKKSSAEDAETQRGSLIEQLSNNSYECMVCCDIVRREASVWSCNNCYHIFHLRCIKRWARTPTAEEGEGQGWRCPACQNVTDKVPSQYRCFCGKVREPDSNRFETPHSCAEVCGRNRSGDCHHACNILCHPGPCPPCQATVKKACDCGKTKKTVPCGQASALKCTEQCQKVLNCGKHECAAVCHAGPCVPCEVNITQVCYCSKEDREVKCGTSDSFLASYSCQEKCLRDLDCGNHKCQRLCHPGLCDGCEFLPSAVTHCPCGHTPLAKLTEPGAERLECTDPLPTCDSVCGKMLGCGPADSPHSCCEKCHTADCGPCVRDSLLVCRCGANTQKMPCVEANQFNDSNPFRCERRCHKKKQCGRHKCSQLCCVDKEHKCDMICGGKLTCGLHRCEEPCHRGNCPTCWHVIFEEMKCHCGATVLEPPIACGTRPPECHNVCTRQHDCAHPVRHYCHSEHSCPPCTQLTVKWCMGKHQQRKNIPCHVTDISCGLTCDKSLVCRQHKCQKPCHKGLCVEDDGASCRQPCTVLREGCEHPCGAPCHSGSPCPNVACRAEILIKCECGYRTERALCLQGGGDFQRMEASMLAMEISRAQNGQGIDIGGINRKKSKKLECNSECGVIERNKRLALALEIRNPDVSGKLATPSFTPFLKDYAKQNLSFVSEVERQLSNLVQMAEKSKQSKRSHAFPAGNRDQRRLVHELAEFYGCETVAYDQEPKKNVVATAYKNKCWHPSLTLTNLAARELNKPLKAPAPITLRTLEKDTRSAVPTSKPSTEIKSAWTALGSTSRKPSTMGSASATSNSSTRSAKPEPVIDYFDMTD